jgi:tetratricopeptide (TPR) repeat protein
MAKNNIISRSLRKQADDLFHTQQFSAAAERYDRIWKKNRLDADARVMQAICHIQLNDLKQAEEICKQAIRLNPNHALAHHALGTAYDRLDRHAEAITEFSNAIRLRPDFANAYLFLANTFAKQGNNSAAESNFLRTLELEPGLVGAMTGLGDLYTRSGRFSEAIILYQRALETAPDNSSILAALGDALSARNDQGEARTVLEKAIRIDPGAYEANFSLGTLLIKLGEYDEAINCYTRASKARPDDGYAIGAIAQIRERRSEFDEALKLLQPFIEQGSSNAGITLPFAELSVQSGKHSDAIRALEKTLAREKLDQSTRTEIHFKLGKILDTIGEYDNAFAHYQSGNDLILQVSKGLPAGETIDVQACEIWQHTASCDKAFWETLPVANNNFDCPVFVVGMPRSGTTLTEQILASHPDVHGAGELAGIESIARSLAGALPAQGKYPASLNNIPARLLDQAADRHLQSLEKLSGSAARVVDKCPHNFLHLGLICVLYPRAKIIHIKRDPRDTCLSIYFQIFTPQHAYACDLDALGRFYNVYRELMRYWNSMLGKRIMNIKYEQLVENPETVSRELIDHCGLQWDDRCLKFYENRRDVNTPSYGQVRQPLYTASIGRWQHYREHLDRLLNVLEDTTASLK